MTLVGVDLGGTSIRAAMATGPGTHGPPVRRDTPAHEGPQAVLDAVAEAAREAAGGAKLLGVAIGIPGPLDPASGRVYEAPNLPGWHGVEAGRLLSDRLGCTVAVHNDAKLAAYAEWRHGAGRGTRHMLFLTVSTGVGGGVIADGRLLTGAAGTAGELGHIAVEPGGRACSQGHIGCLEGQASGTAIAGRAVEALAAGVASPLREIDPNHLDATAVEAAARAGDTLARRLYDEAGRALGRAIGGYINVFSPEVVVIGGGLIQTRELLLDPLRAAVAELGFEVARNRCRLEVAALGTDAGLVGATAWALDELGRTASP
jgi:glucokinase